MTAFSVSFTHWVIYEWSESSVATASMAGDCGREWRTSSGRAVLCRSGRTSTTCAACRRNTSRCFRSVRPQSSAKWSSPLTATRSCGSEASTGWEWPKSGSAGKALLWLSERVIKCWSLNCFKWFMNWANNCSEQTVNHNILQTTR